MRMTIHSLLERNARKFPDKEAFITNEERITYREMNKTCNKLAKYLQQKRIAKGDRIAIFAGNNSFFFYAYFSLMKLGAIPMPVNVRLTSAESIILLENTHADGILYDSTSPDVISEVQHQYPLTHPISIQNALEAATLLTANNLDISIDSRDVCEILFTSGTTGTPKGVLFSHERILAIAAAVSIEFHLSGNDRMLTLMPLTHSAPLNTFFISGLYCGCTHIVGDFTPDAFLRLIDKEKATFSFAAPVAYLLTAKMKELHQYDLSSMRIFAYGGGPLALAAYERVKEAYQNDNFYQVYGLTEAGPNGMLLRPEEHLTKAGSIGKYPTVNMEIRIVRADGTEAETDEYGEILLSGDSLMLGYDQNPEAASAVLENGWLRTGDVAYRDEDGYVFIIDRMKDVIISGGINIYPREIEEVLAQHDAIMETCVVGVPHEEWGETVKAYVVLNHDCTEEEIREFAGIKLADFKCPRIYEFVQELPRNASGKVLKQTLREQ